MKDWKAYVVEAWVEGHATWNGEYAPRYVMLPPLERSQTLTR